MNTLKQILCTCLLLIFFWGIPQLTIAQVVEATDLKPMRNQSAGLYSYMIIEDKDNVNYGGLMTNYQSSLYGLGNNLSLYTYGNRDFVFRTNHGNMILKSSTNGKVGVYTMSPEYNFDLKKTGSKLFRLGNGVGSDFTIDVAAGGGQANLVSGAYNSSGATYKYTGTRGSSRIRLNDGTMQFYVGQSSGVADQLVSYTTGMSIDASGKVTIPSEASIGDKLYVGSGALSATDAEVLIDTELQVNGDATFNHNTVFDGAASFQDEAEFNTAIFNGEAYFYDPINVLGGLDLNSDLNMDDKAIRFERGSIQQDVQWGPYTQDDYSYDLGIKNEEDEWVFKYHYDNNWDPYDDVAFPSSQLVVGDAITITTPTNGETEVDFANNVTVNGVMKANKLTIENDDFILTSTGSSGGRSGSGDVVLYAKRNMDQYGEGDVSYVVRGTSQTSGMGSFNVYKGWGDSGNPIVDGNGNSIGENYPASLQTIFNIDANDDNFKCTDKFSVYSDKLPNSSQSGWRDLLFKVQPTPGDAQRAQVDIYGDLTVFHPDDAPDYVFAEDYDLKTIEEVADFIEKNHHLPGVNSAQEFADDGVNTVQTIYSLLEKIEELTLYTIDQERELKEKDAQLSEVLKRLDALEAKVK